MVEYPKMLYRPGSMMQVGSVMADHITVNSAEEEKALGKGWYTTPANFPQPSAQTLWLKNVFRPWWNEWEWLVKAATIILGAIAALIVLAAKFLG